MIAVIFVVFILTFLRFLFIVLPAFDWFRYGDLRKYLKSTHYAEYPLYTILVPMFMEGIGSISKCRKSITELRYPNIEVLYLCEEVDTVAIAYLSNVTSNTKHERVVVVPRVTPFTKPKACNYGLEIAKGKYIVIYDIEDKPHPLQLHVASYVFNKSRSQCVQFPLRFIYNGTILSLWQCIDYEIWFGKLLPLCFYLNLPIPLGGTSNHFVVSVLRESGGWNPYNVTEDAELGLRLGVLNKKITFVNHFPTQETTVLNIVTLVNQRTRWAKGHILTFIQYAPIFITNFSIRSFFGIFYLLFSNIFICTSFFYIYLMMGEVNTVIRILITANVVMFFLLPLWCCVFLKKGGRQMWKCVFTYNLYVVFYVIPILKAIIECILLPSYWYKTKR